MRLEAGEPEQKTITMTPGGDGSGVTIRVPRGFGAWYLHFPETMLLEGPAQGKAEMTKTEKDGAIILSGKMEGEFAHSIQITYRPGEDVIDVGLEVSNLSQAKWPDGGEAMACLRPVESPEFSEEDGRRTFVFFRGELRPVADVMTEFGKALGPTTTVSLMVKGERMAPFQAQRHDARMTMDDGLILRASVDNKRVAAFAWDRVHRVSMNFTYSCMHSNPRITDLAPGAKDVRRGRIYFLDGSTEDFLKRYRQDFGRK